MSNFKQQSFSMPVNSNKYRSTAFDKPGTLFKKLNVIVILCSLFFNSNAFAQRENIDSLKKVLPLLKDSARVDCLNALSEAYLKVNEPIKPIPYRNIIGDTAAFYANLAYSEGVPLNYVHGIAESLSHKGEIALFSDNFPAEEKLSREAIDLYRKTSNKRRLAKTYYLLGHALYAQSKFSEAIRNLDTAFDLHKKDGDRDGIYWTLLLAYWVYDESGNYEKGFEVAMKTLDIAIQNKNDFEKELVLGAIASLYMSIEDYKSALEYYRQLPMSNIDLVELFTLMHQYDSAKHYFGLLDTSHLTRKDLVKIGEYYFSQKQYIKALPNFLRGLHGHQQVNDRNQVMRASLDIAKTYLAIGNNDSAVKYGNATLNLAIQTSAKQFIRDASEILSSVYDHWHKPDSAYFYYRQFTKMKDSVQNNVIKGKLAAFTFEQKLELLNKEKQIQQVKLQKQSLLKNILVGAIIILLLLAAIIIRNIILKRRNEKLKLQHELELQKLESEKTRSELLQQSTELEMQALRAQMNPHFIFNSLNSINCFILQNNKAQASEYLTKFSRLVRMILQNSQAAFITLENELEALQLYLELEAVRFDHQFEYKVIVDEDIDESVIKVPPLIIQPYAENAIWHGLKHLPAGQAGKEEKGILEIKLFSQHGMLYCRITDNGVGRKRAGELKSKSASSHKSIGLRITADRIARMQQNKTWVDYITVNDLQYADGRPAGTEVLLKIPLMRE